jgi:hypothetical protein
MAKRKHTKKAKRGGLTLAELFGQNRADFPLKQPEYVRPPPPPPPKYVPPPPPPPPEPELPGTTTSTPPSEPEEVELHVPRPPPPKKLPPAKTEVNSLWLPKPTYGTQSEPDIRFYGVQRHTKAKGKGRRKTRRRKTNRRRR